MLSLDWDKFDLNHITTTTSTHILPNQFCKNGERKKKVVKENALLLVLPTLRCWLVNNSAASELG